VTLLVNMNEIRKNPVGVQAGPLMSAIPQWDEFMAGTKVDPVKDTDWVLITGPSLRDTSRDIILVHYSTSDVIVDRAIDLIQKRSSNGAPFDAGVPGVKASLAHADRAPRVFLRPQSHLVAVTPPDVAAASARILKTARVNPHVRQGEAMRLVLKHPHGPFPQIFPEEMTELDIWIIPRAAGGADVYGDGICPNEQIAAAATAQAVKMFRTFTNSLVGGIANGMSGNTLDGIGIIQDGAHVKATAPISQDQLQAMLNLAAMQLNVVLPASSAAAGSPGAAPPKPPPH
jgi:hypothetical protein